MKTALAAFIALLTVATALGNERGAFRIVRTLDHGEVVVDPYISPILWFHVVAGTVPKNVVNCKQSQGDMTVYLECDGSVKMQLNGIELVPE